MKILFKTIFFLSIFMNLSSSFANEEFRKGYESFLNKNYATATQELQAAQISENYILIDYYRFALGRSWIEIGNLIEGSKILEKLLEQDMDSYFADSARLALAKILVSQKKYREAKSFIKSSLSQIKDEKTEFLLLLASAQIELGEKDEALHYLKEAYLVFPDATIDAEVKEKLTLLGKTSWTDEELLTRAKAWFAKKNYSEAIETGIELSKKTNFRDRVLIFAQQGEGFFALKRNREAISAFEFFFREKIKHIEPELLRKVQLHYSLALLGENRVREARKQIDELIAASPNSEEAAEGFYRFGIYYGTQKQWKEADAIWKTMITKHPHGSFRDRGLWSRAWEAYMIKDWKNASYFLKAMENGAEDAPTRAKALYWQARILENEKQESKARASFEKAAQASPWSYYGFMALKQIEGNERDPSKTPKIPNSWKESQKPSLPASGDVSGSKWHKSFLKSVELYKVGLGRFATRELQRSLKEAQNEGQLAALLHEMENRAIPFMTVWFMQRNWVAFEGLFRDNTTAENYRNAVQFPRAYLTEVQTAAQEFGVDPNLVLGLMRQESSFQPWITSPANAQGLMQMLPSTAEMRAKAIGTTVTNLFSPSQNVRLGTAELDFLLKKFSGNWVDAICGYNAGPARPPQWRNKLVGLAEDEYVESIPFNETNLYVKLVLRNYWNYKSRE